LKANQRGKKGGEKKECDSVKTALDLIPSDQSEATLTTRGKGLVKVQKGNKQNAHRNAMAVR